MLSFGIVSAKIFAGDLLGLHLGSRRVQQLLPCAGGLFLVPRVLHGRPKSGVQRRRVHVHLAADLLGLLAVPCAAIEKTMIGCVVGLAAAIFSSVRPSMSGTCSQFAMAQARASWLY